MAVRQVSETDSLDKLRIEFNALAANDFGDISNLSSTLSATSVIDAVNEINSIAIAAAGFILSDGSNTQAVASGNTMLVSTGTGITATVSSPDTLNLALNSNLTGLQTLDVSQSADIANITISNNSITSAGGSIDFGNEQLSTTGGITSGGTLVGAGLTINGASMQFEGSTANSFETRLQVSNPTADRVITIPDITGSLITTADTGTVTSTMLANNAVGTSQIANSSVTVDKLNVASSTLTVDTLVANTITGTADIASQVALTADNTSNATKYITFSDSPTGNQGLKTDTGLFYNPATNVLTTTATQAQYADLAEKYTSDKEYEEGTIMCIGGHAETTACGVDHCQSIAGVVSDIPAYLMNHDLEGTSVNIALTGRVPVKVCGPVRKGDLIVSCEKTGCGRREAEPRPGALVGKSLVNCDKEEERLIECLVGR